MFSRILVATDGSDHGSKVAEVAADLAAKYDAHLTVGQTTIAITSLCHPLRRTFRQ